VSEARRVQMDGGLGGSEAGWRIRRRAVVLASLVAFVLMAMASSASAAPPEILSSFVSQVGTETAVLKATVNPKGKVVGYRFEYGLSDCSVNPCTTEPGLQGTLSTKSTEPEALPPALLEGLAPGTTYHFRLVVENSSKETANGPDRAFKTFSPSPAFPPCPNDAFRLGSLAPPGAPSAQLPDCRSYEQASPAYKQGEDARGVPGSIRAAAEGGGITFNTTNGIPGGEGGQEIPTYLATRGPNSWSAQGLSPAQSAGPTAVVLGWTPDFSAAIEMVREPEEGNPTALLERSSAGGALTTIVPLTPQLSPAFAAANADGSLVLFESKVALPSVAGAIEGKPNLYLWERGSGEITLAGALNDEQAPPLGALAGAYDWAAGTSPKTLAEGGALSRGYYTQDNHVMSADGSAVYFTAAGSGKLYARLNPTAPQSALNGEEECTEAGKACTIEVSASQRGIPDPVGTRPAAFAAATPDGSRALFLSAEKLTEDANTGPEPPAPSISRAGVGGAPVEPNFLGERGAGVAVAGEYLYWADPLAGFIGRAKLNGAGAATEVEPEFIQIAGHPRWVAVGGEYLYWSEEGEGEEKGEGLTDEGSIGRARLDKSEPPEAGILSGLSDPQGVAVDGEHLYWASYSRAEARAYIGRANPDGSGAEVKWLPRGGEVPEGVAVSAAGVYWSSNVVFDATSGERLVWRANLDGSGLISVKVSEKTEEGNMRGIALDAGHVYWASSRTGEGDKFEIGRANLSLEEVERDFIPVEGKPKGVAADGEHLYWTLNGEPPVNPGTDLYRFEAGKPAGERLTDLSADPAEENGAEVRGLLGVSEDGARVYFAANGVLTNTPNEAGEAAAPGDCRGSIADEGEECETNLYLSRPDSAHPGQLESVFIARVSGADHDDWRPNSAEAVTSNYAPRASRVSPGGEALLFASRRNLTPYDSEGTSELYLYREGAGIRCVSCNSSGAPPQGAPDMGDRLKLSFLGPTSPAPLLTRSLSSDGRQVFFETTDTLLPGDTNGAEGCPVVGPFNGSYPSCLDVYEWEAKGSGSCESEAENGGCLYLISPAGSREASFLGDASASGKGVFFFTRSPLVRQDEDRLLDVYDARVEGGLTSQNVVPAPICEGDTCKPSPTGPPPFQSPQTPGFQGPANPKEKGCPKGKRKVTQKGKTRCVAKKKKKSNKKGEPKQKAGKSGRAER
jgi:hypothetical protein